MVKKNCSFHAVSRKLAEASGGRIQVRRKPGVGSPFTLYLPVAREMK
jgi:signal transduction histidine kinase